MGSFISYVTAGRGEVLVSTFDVKRNLRYHESRSSLMEITRENFSVGEMKLSFKYRYAL